MNEPNPAVKQSHIDSALTQLNTQRHALEVQLEAVVAGITALEHRLLHLNPEQTDTPPTQGPGGTVNDTPGLRIVTPIESTIPDGDMNAGPCPNTTDGNHVANEAGRCTHCGSQVTTPTNP